MNKKLNIKLLTIIRRKKENGDIIFVDLFGSFSNSYSSAGTKNTKCLNRSCTETTVGSPTSQNMHCYNDRCSHANDSCTNE